jgi:hypothetical protein
MAGSGGAGDRILGRHKRDLLEGMGGRWLLGNEPKLQMIDDPVHGGIIGDEGDDLHHFPALRTDHRIDLIDVEFVCPPPIVLDPG